MEKSKNVKIILTAILVIICPYASLIMWLFLAFSGFGKIAILLGMLVIPLAIPLVWLKKKKAYAIGYVAFLVCFAAFVATKIGINIYNESITIDVAPSINVDEYLPFEEKSKIVKLRSESLDFENVAKEDLPIIDGAAAVFPVYSAFVNAVYPDTTELYDGVFEYNNTPGGYKRLAQKKIDIFIGAAPSKEQIAFAEETIPFSNIHRSATRPLFSLCIRITP